MATAPSEPIPISTSNPNVNVDASGNITPAETPINNSGVVKFNVTFPPNQNCMRDHHERYFPERNPDHLIRDYEFQRRRSGNDQDRIVGDSPGARFRALLRIDSHVRGNLHG
jgi:hypothetical protein